MLTVLELFQAEPERSTSAPIVPIVEVAQIRWADDGLPVVASGFVQPLAQIALSAQVGGEVVSVASNLVSGGLFKEGDELVRLDPRSYEAARQRVLGDLAAAEAEIEFFRLQVQKFQKLVAEESAAQTMLDEAISSRDRVAGQLVSLRAQVASAELDLERTRIVAPFSGRVLSVDVDVGAVVEPGRELARIFANEFLEVVVGLRDDDVRWIPGIWSLNQAEIQPAVRVQVDFAGQLYEWPGFLHRVEAALDDGSRSVNAAIRIPDPDSAGRPLRREPAEAESPPLLVGMYANAILEGRFTNPVAAIPKAALRDGENIWVLDADDTLRIVPAQVLRILEEDVLMRADGLSSTTRVVTTNLLSATDGMKVRVSRRINP
ncbi:MAG: efflux RND transporter periplasmic adaptor subunit [Gammaproteobacteria bacterium]|nr:efflux RND transporter periplasmic adaptor subunit [Gammaproteobacteria bacterium]